VIVHCKVPQKSLAHLFGPDTSIREHNGNGQPTHGGRVLFAGGAATGDSDERSADNESPRR